MKIENKIQKKTSELLMFGFLITGVLVLQYWRGVSSTLDLEIKHYEGQNLTTLRLIKVDGDKPCIIIEVVGGIQLDVSHRLFNKTDSDQVENEDNNRVSKITTSSTGGDAKTTKKTYFFPFQTDASITQFDCQNTTSSLQFDFGERWPQLELGMLWRREPDSYETGEVGWSSVGAYPDTYSGTYMLEEVRAVLPRSAFSGLEEGGLKEVGLSHQIDKSLATVSNESIVEFAHVDKKRFKTRSGDYFECETEKSYQLKPVNKSQLPALFEALPPVMQPEISLKLFRFRLQTFIDLRHPHDFTGTNQQCQSTGSGDSTLALGIGIAVSAVLVLVLICLAIGRLREKEEQFNKQQQQETFTNGWGQYKKIDQQPPATSNSAHHSK